MVSGRRFRTRASENTLRTAVSSALEPNSGALGSNRHKGGAKVCVR